MKPLIFIPGAWMGEWIWEDLKILLEKFGHKIYSITLTGLESENSSKNIGLQDHVNDVKKFIEEKNLTDVVLIGHSYSGFVIGQLADQIPDKIFKIIFLEAFFPTNGRNLLQAAGLDINHEIQNIQNNKGNWPPPTLEELKQQKQLSEKQIIFLNKKLINHPGKSVLEDAKITSEKLDIKSIFIGSKLNMNNEQESLYGNVEFYELNGGHWPMLTETKKLSNLLNNIVG